MTLGDLHHLKLIFPTPLFSHSIASFLYRQTLSMHVRPNKIGVKLTTLKAGCGNSRITGNTGSHVTRNNNNNFPLRVLANIKNLQKACVIISETREKSHKNKNKTCYTNTDCTFFHILKNNLTCEIHHNSITILVFSQSNT